MRAARLPLLVLLAAAAPAAADPPRAEVERLLGGYEVTVGPEDFRRLGPGTDRVLVDIARDPQTSELRRVRALAALLYVPTDLGRDTCRDVVRRLAGADGGMESLEVAACADTLGAFGAIARAELVPLLEHPVVDVRAAAARAVGAGRMHDADAALRRRLPIEADAGVRRALAESLRKLAVRR